MVDALHQAIEHIGAKEIDDATLEDLLDLEAPQKLVMALNKFRDDPETVKNVAKVRAFRCDSFYNMSRFCKKTVLCSATWLYTVYNENSVDNEALLMKLNKSLLMTTNYGESLVKSYS